MRITLKAALPAELATDDVLALAGALCRAAAEHLPSTTSSQDVVGASALALVVRVAVEQAVTAVGGTLRAIEIETSRPRGRHRRDH